MAHMIKIRKWINQILETENHFVDSLEKAIEFIEKYPNEHCIIFDENGNHKHERQPVTLVNVDVPVSLSVVVS